MTSSADFPEGAYFSVIGNVRLEAGGQTRLALLRHRLFTEHAGLDFPILTYNPLPSYDPIRRELLRQGQLLPTSELRNLHEELRTWTGLGNGTSDLPDLGDPVDDVDEGYRWRQRYRVDTDDETWDYLRPDGTRYLRTPPTDVAGDVFLCGDDGRPVQSWAGLGGVWRWWTSRVIPTEGPVFLISDSRFIAEELGRLHEPRVHLMHQMHNPHLTGDRAWWSPVSESYQSSMEHLADLDGLLSLTDRQRADIAARYGDTSNLFVIPNPVVPPQEVAEAPERTPHGIVMIARLDGQKRLDRAVDALALVREKVPDATLDVYGDGPLRDELEQRIAKAGLQDAVTLHGHDPQARDALSTGALFWLTSQFEGYPLSTLEAMSHGCPVVSMDMPYGPREQITDGDDGYLVPRGDINALAARTVELFKNPKRLEAMRELARAKAADHGHSRFLSDWANVVEQVRELKPRRRSVSRERWNLTHSQMTGRRAVWTGTLDIDTPFATHLDELKLTAQVWSPDTDAIADVPMEVGRAGSRFTFSGNLDARAIGKALPGTKRYQLRIGYTWQQLASLKPLTDAPVTFKRRWFG